METRKQKLEDDLAQHKNHLKTLLLPFCRRHAVAKKLLLDDTYTIENVDFIAHNSQITVYYTIYQGQKRISSHSFLRDF